MNIEYQPGKENTLADTLSRLPSTQNSETIDLDLRVDFIRFHSNRVTQLQEETKKDAILSELSEVIVNGWPESIKELPTASGNTGHSVTNWH